MLEVNGVRALGRPVLHGARLVLPVDCPGCGRPDVRLCDPCASAFVGPPFRCDDAAPALARSGGRWPVWAVADYAASVRSIILAWKDHGRGDLAPMLAGALCRSATALASVLCERAAALTPSPGHSFERGPKPRLTVVPMPSSWSARRRRGGCVVTSLARAVAVELGCHLDARMVHAFTLRTVGRQAMLDRRARFAHRQRELVLAGPRPSAPVLLVDDIVTTGATLATAATLLDETAGCPVVGGLALAATPPPRRAQ